MNNGMNFQKNNKVCAVVVTYNRLKLLKRCIDLLRQQTFPCDILVINNGSSDGTREWLEKQDGLNVITQENLGGAGGFSVGMRTAYEGGWDYVWSMDDDGSPVRDCLEELISHGVDDKVLSPLVVDESDESALAFALRYKGEKLLTVESAQAAAGSSQEIVGVGCPFNGILIHKNIYKKIGFPLAGFFQWGDEVEFILRAKRAGYDLVTVMSAKHRHPKDRVEPEIFVFLGKSFKVNKGGSPLKDYILIRNQAYILNQYYSLRQVINLLLSNLAWAFKKRKLSQVAMILGATCSGVLGKFEGHKKYLKS